MYRVLASRAAVQERRPQRTHPEYKKPELMATGPNQVWSWDITRLLGPKKWSYFYLYVILDIFSRYAVGWMVADRENSALAGRLIQQSCLKYGVQPRVLTLHSDRGAPMTSQCTAQLLADLGVTRSLSRPRVSDDNPFSEAQFNTLKYHPSFPGRFDDQGQAKNFCRSFFPWYNAEHRHGGISMLTPEQLHFGLADEIIARREAVLRAAWAAHPDRFVSGEPKPKPLPEAVWINPPTPTLTTQEIALQLITPSVSQPLTGSGEHSDDQLAIGHRLDMSGAYRRPAANVFARGPRLRLLRSSPGTSREVIPSANQAVAFAKISRSSFTCRSSRFSRLSSSRSGVVRPSLRRPSSRSARSAHFRIVVAVRSNSFANCSGLRPARTNSTIWFRNSTGYGFLVPPTVTPPLPQSGSVHQLGARSPLERFAVSLLAHEDGIVNHARYPIHTGTLEGVHNRIKVIKRQAYGFRDNQYFILKAKAAFPGRLQPDHEEPFLHTL